MGVDHETHGLVRDCLPGRRDDRQAASIALATLDDQYVIAHVDGQRRVVAADLEDAVTDAFDGWSARRLPTTATAAATGCTPTWSASAGRSRTPTAASSCTARGGRRCTAAATTTATGRRREQLRQVGRIGSSGRDVRIEGRQTRLALNDSS